MLPTAVNISLLLLMTIVPLVVAARCADLRALLRRYKTCMKVLALTALCATSLETVLAAAGVWPIGPFWAVFFYLACFFLLVYLVVGVYLNVAIHYRVRSESRSGKHSLDPKQISELVVIWRRWGILHRLLPGRADPSQLAQSP